MSKYMLVCILMFCSSCSLLTPTVISISEEVGEDIIEEIAEEIVAKEKPKNM